MKLMTVSSLLALSLLAACTTSTQREMAREVLSNYSSYTGEPVSQFSMHTRFDGWTAVDNEHVLVHTNVNETYLLEVAPTCFDLPFTNTLGVTSKFPNTVQSGFDSIRVGRDTCRILQIRPVNWKQMKQDLAEARSSKAKG
jgi:hypothetical protein